MSRLIDWFHSGPARIRLRRKLFLFSAPLLLLALAVVLKLIVMVTVGRSVVSDFERHDIEALRADISVLSLFNVIEPGKLAFAEGDLRVLEGRLTDAENQFRKTLERTDRAESCPARINLELVRETLGDLASRGGNKEQAEQRYVDALQAVRDAPDGCFAGNDDPNEDRRKIRNDAEPRLLAKINSLHRPPPPEPAPPPTVTPQPTPTSLTPTSGPPLPGGGGGQDGETTSPQPDGGGGGGGGGSPSPPPTTAPAPNPDAPGPGDGPVFGPGGGGNDGTTGMNDVDPDRLPTSGQGAGTKPGHQLGPGDPLDRLREALENANASGDNTE